MYTSVYKSSRPFWLSHLFTRFYCLLILLVIALQITSVVIMLKYSLLKTYSLTGRDVFVSNDKRTMRMDVENMLNEKARKNAESIREEIASVEDMINTGDIRGLLDKVATIQQTDIGRTID